MMPITPEPGLVIYIAPLSPTKLCFDLETNTSYHGNCRYCDRLVDVPPDHLYFLGVLDQTGANPLVVCLECWSTEQKLAYEGTE